MTRSHLPLAFALCLSLQAHALEVPKLEARITDLAGLLSSEDAAVLESRLRDLETTDSTQVAVLIIPSLEGEVLEEYSERVATAWRLGQKGRDNRGGMETYCAPSPRLLNAAVLPPALPSKNTVFLDSV